MKISITALLLAAGIFLISSDHTFAQQKEPEGTITLSGAWAIYPTAVAWGEGFQKKYPNVKVDVSAGGAGKGVADAIAGLVDVGMVSREPEQAEIEKGISPVYILHDAVYPAVSETNPFIKDLFKKGVSKKTWVDMYITGAITTWDAVVGGTTKKPLHVYTRSDSCGAAASWAKYLDKKQEDLRGIGVYGDPGLLDASKKDPLGIGYSNFSYVFTREGTVLKGVKVVPIDANENGSADADEIYTTRAQAIKAIEEGKYPVTRKNYFFIKGRAKGLVKEFIAFALSEEGTKIVEEVGTSLPLQKAEREKILKSLE
ncbi:MAG: substrate-binding domain-containing protein [Pseudomonadota bacterium]